MLSGTPQGGVISPLLSNIYLSFLDDVWQRRCRHLGVLVRYCDDFVVLCRTSKACDETERRVKMVLERLKLELHPEKTRKVDLSWGKQGFDFLGCHLRKRLSGPLWEKEHIRRYFLHRWPSTKSMNRVRQKVRQLTHRRWLGAKDVREVIERLNPVLRGWGNYFRSGNASIKFCQIDRYVRSRLQRWMRKRKGRHLRAGEWQKWTGEFFQDMGLIHLHGSIEYPETA